MSFSFDFSGGDIDSDEEGPLVLAQALADVSISRSTAPLPAKRHRIEELLSSLPSQISYAALSLSPESAFGVQEQRSNRVKIVRRSLFDIKAQLMAEADAKNGNDSILSGLDRGDLTSGVYEGGFKTWECAVDLALLLCSLDIQTCPEDWHVIELGTGSALPSMVLLTRALQTREHNSEKRFHFTLCDYNEDVLRLCTAPNIFLAGYDASQKSESTAADNMSEELETGELNESTTKSVIQDYAQRNITFEFISGAWGDDCVDLCRPSMEGGDSTQAGGVRHGLKTLILASETIYSPDTTRIFVDTLLKLLDRGGKNSRALIAAKRIYFGVGGGVAEFVREATSRGAKVSTVADMKSEGVGRVVLEVTMARPSSHST